MRTVSMKPYRVVALAPVTVPVRARLVDVEGGVEDQALILCWAAIETEDDDGRRLPDDAHMIVGMMDSGSDGLQPAEFDSAFVGYVSTDSNVMNIGARAK